MPEEKRLLKVFLCHASADKSAVRGLYKRLNTEGWVEPWLDENKILPGQDWDYEIRKAVREADVIIVCISRYSKTREGYVQKEIKFALDIADEKPEGTIYIIPVLLEKCDPPERLQRWQWLNLYVAKGYNLLLASLQRRAKVLELESVPYKRTMLERLLNYLEKRKETVFSTLGILLALLAFLFGDNIYGQITGHAIFPGISTSTPTATRTIINTVAPTTTSAPASPTSTPIPPYPSNWVTYYSDLNGNRDIFELNPATGVNRAVIIDPSHDKVGTWSPEGEFLAFESNRNSTIYYQIYLFDLAQGRVTGLTELAECSNWSPAWSPDGKKIVFYSNCENDRRDIYIMNRDGSGRKKLTSSGGDNKFPAFSPNGNIITFTSTRNGGNQILLMNSDGSNQRVIADGCSSTFSPDGNWLWFSTNCDDSDIKRIRITGTNLSTIGTKFGQNPSLSRDGLFVVFQSYDDIWMMGVDGSNPTQLTSGSAVDGAPSWKP